MPQIEEGLFTRSGSKKIWARYTGADGEQVRRSTGIGTDAPDALKEARALLSKWRAEVHQERMWGRAPEPEKHVDRHLFDDVIVEYIEGHEVRSPFSTRKSAIKALKRWFGGLYMDEITEVDVRAYTRGRMAGTGSDGMHDPEVKPVKAGTVNKEVGLFAAAANWCRKELGWNIHNPAKGMKRPEPEGRVRWITYDEAIRLLKAASENKRAPWLMDSIYISLFTGMRFGEVANLTWSQIDFDRAMLVLETGTTKNGKRRSVALHPEALAALQRRHEFVQEYCPDTQWVFCRKNGSHVKEMRKSFASARKKAGITDFRRHDARHTFASWLRMSGADLAVVRDALGHSTIKMTERYAHLDPSHIRSAVYQIGVAQFKHSRKKREKSPKEEGGKVLKFR